MEAPARWWSLTGLTTMTLLTPAKAPAMTGQFCRSLPPGRLRGTNRPALGVTIRAPVDRAAPAKPLISKQLSGLLMGLSVTSTRAAPAWKHRPATAARTSGWVVAPREAGVAKA